MNLSHASCFIRHGLEIVVVLNEKTRHIQKFPVDRTSASHFVLLPFLLLWFWPWQEVCSALVHKSKLNHSIGKHPIGVLTPSYCAEEEIVFKDYLVQS